MSEKLTELLARLDAATGPDREIDWAVFSACGFRVNDLQKSRWRVWLVDNWAPLPPVTASIDAALALVERLLPGSFYHFAKGRVSEREPLFGFQILFGADEVIGSGESNHACIAVILAALRALIADQVGINVSEHRSPPMTTEAVVGKTDSMSTAPPLQVYCLRVIDQDALDRRESEYYRYTSTTGFVVLACSEQEARSLARNSDPKYPETWWLDPTATSCALIEVSGEPRIIMADEPTG